MAKMAKNPPVSVGDLGLIPGLVRSAGGGRGHPLSPGESQGQRSLGATVHGVAQTQRRLSD